MTSCNGSLVQEQENNDGLVVVHMHKKPLDPNRATTMPGVPAEVRIAAARDRTPHLTVCAAAR